MNDDKKLITYDQEPGTFSDSSAIPSIRYRMLENVEWKMLVEYHGSECDAQKYSQQPPPRVTNIIAQMKLNDDCKTMKIMQRSLFPTEAALVLICPPERGNYTDRKFLAARWALGEADDLLSFEEIKQAVKKQLTARRIQALKAALERVDADVERYLNDAYGVSVGFE